MLESAVGWLAGIALDLLLNCAVVWLIMDLIGLVMELFSRLFLGKSRGLFLSPTYNTIRWNLEKRKRQEIAERARKIRPIRRPAPLPVQTAAAKVIALRTKTKQRKDGWPETRYTVGFQLSDGGEVWLSVSKEQHASLAEGDAGLLVFQGKLFRSFQKYGEGTGGR